MAKKKKISKLRKFLISGVVVVLLSLAGIGYSFYRKVYAPNISLNSKNEQFIYIPTGSEFIDVLRILAEKNILKNTSSFEWVAERMNYKNNIHPGKYLIRKNMNNRELIAMLRSGVQVPVKVIFNITRTPQELASVISTQLEADSASLSNLLTDNAHLEKYGFDKTTALALFIPNTYEFYWDTDAEEFIKRMAEEYKKFWTSARKAKARDMNLTQTQVSVLASIVEQETRRNDEKPLIAGVYYNRFKKGWKLEADPTLIYAAGDFTIQRVLNIHKEVDSPYNTYMYAGLPPGPICMPSISSLDAVLNYSRHDYMFFCAREDFSGYHSFARTYSQHLLNARRFQKELNRRNIRS